MNLQNTNMNKNTTIPRYGEREPDEYYPTPPGFAYGSLINLWGAGRFGNLRSLDIAAGKGEFATEWKTITGIQADGIDLMPKPEGFKGKWYKGDFLSMTPSSSYERIFMNPPFTLTEEFIHHAYKWMTKDGMLGCFARLSFLEGQMRYQRLFSNWKPAIVVVFDRRINNVGRSSDSIGRCFIIWKFHSMSTELIWHEVSNE
jgi:hypothetical protein